MRLWQAALLAIIVAMFVITIVGIEFDLDVLERVVAGLMASVPGIVIGAGLWWLVQRSTAESAPSSIRTAVLGGILSGATYLALIMRAAESLPDTDGATLAAALWTMYTLPVALVIGAAFGAGWGQIKD